MALRAGFRDKIGAIFSGRNNPIELTPRNITKPLDFDWKQNVGAAFDHTQMTEYGYYAVVSTVRILRLL